MPDVEPIIKKKRNRRKKDFNRKKKASYFRAIFRRFCLLMKKKGPERSAVIEAFGAQADALLSHLDRLLAERYCKWSNPFIKSKSSLKNMEQ